MTQEAKLPLEDSRPHDTAMEENGAACDTETGLLGVSPELGQNGSPDQKLGNATDEGGGTTYDGVVRLVGQFGRYQQRVCFLLCLPSVTGCIQILMSVFTLAVPQHRCAIPGVANDAWTVQNAGHQALVDASIPSHPEYSAQCRLYAQPLIHPDNSSYQGSWNGNLSYPASLNGNSSYQASLNGNVSYYQSFNTNSSRHMGSLAFAGNGSGTVACSRYVYDTSTYKSTVVTQMNLVCEKSLYRSHPQMLVMVGSLVGSQFSFLADIWGRKAVMMLSILLHILASFGVTWTKSYPVYLALMFPVGASVSGMICTSFVLGMELVGPSARRWTGYGVMGFWSLGMLVLAAMAYCIRDWKHLQLAASIVPLPLLSLFWLVPESPRWLLTKGHVGKAEAIIRRIAHTNKRALPVGLMDKIRLPAGQHSWSSVWMACTNRRLAVRYLMIFYIWMVSSLAYYGLSWNVGTLGGSVYANFLLSGLVELVAIGFCVASLDRFGRRPLNCGLMMLAGVTCTSTLFPVLFAPPSLQWMTVVLAMAGKLGITGAFGTVWLFTSELFPTVIRNSGIGASSVCARVGGIMAPYIANSGQMMGGKAATAVPLVIFGVASMLAGVVLLCLPETLNRRLPETVQDAANMGRKAEEPCNKTITFNVKEATSSSPRF